MPNALNFSNSFLNFLKLNDNERLIQQIQRQGEAFLGIKPSLSCGWKHKHNYVRLIVWDKEKNANWPFPDALFDKWLEKNIVPLKEEGKSEFEISGEAEREFLNSVLAWAPEDLFAKSTLYEMAAFDLWHYMTNDNGYSNVDFKYTKAGDHLIVSF